MVAVLASATSPEAMQSLAHGIMIGFGFVGPTISIGLVGASYLSAVGRNPEASKFLGQALVFVGLIEVYGLLAFASTFFVK
jgi:F0F1-type ATP synthase membrane subunit c/vacuolar-type H+-ATPase subunit K